MTHALPRRALRLFEELFQDREKADFMVEDLEKYFQESEVILKNNIETDLKNNVQKEIKEVETDLKTEIKILKIDFSDLKTEMNDLRTEFKILRTEVKYEIANLRLLIIWLLIFTAILGTILNPVFLNFISALFKLI